jgi:peptidoglycan/LPS O-acetylase OafA/YrhL
MSVPATPGHHYVRIAHLRGVAVLVVVLYHLWPDVFRGGFIGVDAFFILSGFVVSAAYFDKVAVGDVAPSAFLWRRVRRLMPAVVVVLLATWTTALFMLEPNEMMLLSKSIFSQVFYVQNFFFWYDGD